MATFLVVILYGLFVVKIKEQKQSVQQDKKQEDEVR